MKERGHGPCNKSSAVNSFAGPVVESQDPKRDSALAEASQGRPLFNHPGDSSSLDSTQSLSVGLRRSTKGDLENPINRQNKDSHGLHLLPNANVQDHRRVRNDGEKESASTNSERGVKQSRKESTLREKDMSERSQSKIDKNRSERERRESTKSSCLSGSGQRQQQDDPVTLRRSGRSKSPTSHAFSPASVSSRSSADTQSRKEEPWHEHGRKRPSGHSSDKSHRTGGMREHHRKEERRQEGRSSLERRHRKRDGTNEYGQRKTPSEERNRPDEKNSDRGEEKSTRSEGGKEHERQSARDAGNARWAGNNADKNKRASDGKVRNQADVRDERGRSSPNHGAENPRKDQDARRRKSGGMEELSKSKASGSWDESRGHVHVSSDRRGVRDKGRRSGTADKGSKNSPDNARIPKPSGGRNVHADGLAGKGRKSPVRSTSSCDGASMAEESSPKRKLTFMETLNLTISPIKKQNNSALPQPRPQKPLQPPPEDALANNPTEGGNSLEVGEVIDGVEEGSVDDSSACPTDTTRQPHDTEPPPCLEVMGKDQIRSGKADCTASEMQEEEESVLKADDCPTGCISEKCVVDETADPGVSLLPDPSRPVDSPTVPLTGDSQASAKENVERRVIGAQDAGEEDRINPEPEASSVHEDSSQLKVTTCVVPSPTAKTCLNTDTSQSLDVVSVCVEKSDQAIETIAVSDPEVTQGLEDPKPSSNSLPTPSTEAVILNTTAQEEGTPPKQPSSPEPDSAKSKAEISKPSQGVTVPYDEDSMMLTLSNIEVIPEAISPLTSPVRQIRKPQQQQQRLGRETHVKSLSKGQ